MEQTQSATTEPTATAEPTGYVVYDRVNGSQSKPYATRKAASRVADRLDLAYGAIRYGVRAV